MFVKSVGVIDIKKLIRLNILKENLHCIYKIVYIESSIMDCDFLLYLNPDYLMYAKYNFFM
ncbi:hypothetical protein GLYMA_17G068000v4 [Glycine max]|uniref:Uncharacterized protein n=1 Tax=Glycine max TaxID=3847 RepID=I1MSW1_SOYBN|nr:hypothetical protein GYH30_046484 [Glycine max]KRH02940.1 hypothetical protein GLYMA_17G068000v4 [Glycine max]